jgi:hypothetical protein
MTPVLAAWCKKEQNVSAGITERCALYNALWRTVSQSSDDCGQIQVGYSDWKRLLCKIP